MTAGFEFCPRLAEFAREGGELLMNFFRRSVTIEYKAEADLVTVADRACEKLLIERIRAEWPSHDVIGEEGARRSSGSDYLWYVDPLDGTTNFAHGFPVFCISIGLEHRGQLIAGIIYDPTRDELFAAEEGKGAFLNGAPMHVSATPKMAASLLGTGFPSKKRHQNPNIHFYHQLTMRSHGVRRAGSAALDLASVACGRYDGFWEFNLNPWDTAAGVLLVREAGGVVTNFRGGDFEISSREVLASNRLIYDELLKSFADIFANRDLLPLPSIAEFAKER